MERETNTFTTPLGREVVVKAWLTAGERRKIQEVMIGTESVTATPQFKGDALFRAQDKLVEVAVISYAGSNERVIERLLEEKVEEYDYVAQVAGQVLAPLVEAK